MRIVAGDYKYRKITIPEGIRPTTEKVREAVFSMLSHDIYNAVVCDLFAGSGVMGLEALSRGAAKCYFNDSSRNNLTILKENVENCKAGPKSVIMNYDFRLALNAIHESLDIVILDPPYDSGYYKQVFELLQKNCSLNEKAIIVAEHFYDNKLEVNYGKLAKIKEKKYGTIGVDIYLFD